MLLYPCYTYNAKKTGMQNNQRGLEAYRNGSLTVEPYAVLWFSLLFETHNTQLLSYDKKLKEEVRNTPK